MGRLSRYLLDGETGGSASPIWVQDPICYPMFDGPIVAVSPMWRSSLRLTNAPVFVEEEKPKPEPKWYKEARHVSMCPCCVGSSSMSLSGLPSTCGRASAESADSETSSVRTMKPEIRPASNLPNNRLRRSVTSIGIRFKQSIRGFRHKKASGVQV
ncbi:hypothetical protein VSDG_08797 [Cytospora chrysosperma]|uniref:Uncharacterized protein n=1 Tax=Cytospora chrysosperma TaxID=252740 RepID=A0A423VGU7_CYTCH|nr:hypothetical protein VSDG_08797 [Valsa sordida]